MFFKINNTWGDLIQIKIKNYAEPSDITFFQTKHFFFPYLKLSELRKK